MTNPEENRDHNEPNSKRRRLLLNERPVSIIDFPEDVLRRIFESNSDTNDLISCERTCRTFRRFLSIDDVWQICFNASRRATRCRTVRELDGPTGFQGVTSYREASLIYRTLELVRRTKKSNSETRNIIVDVLGVRSTRNLVNALQNLNVRGGMLHHFDVRGDTLALLTELVQAYIVEKLEHALNVSFHAATKHGLGGFCPEVCVEDLYLVDVIRNHCLFENFFRANRMSTSSLEQEVEVNYDVVSEASKFAIVRRLAYQAGVVKLSNGAFDSLWKDLVRLMIILVDGPCECLMTIS
jgi:hypothetical protein